MLTGHTRIIAHIGYPTGTFKAPMIYNPYFDSIGLDAAVVPMGVKAADFAAALPVIFNMSNIHGALITMPHKVSVVDFLDVKSPAVEIAGACNAVLRRSDGSLSGDMFDGEGFLRGLLRKGRAVRGRSALVIGSGGVGSAIAAALSSAGLARIGLHDVNPASADGLASRLARHFPDLTITIGSTDAAGYDIIVNATPLGMNADDPLPLDVTRIAPAAFVGEVVMKREITAFLAAAAQRGCQTQVGVDMLFEQIPAYLEFFGFPTTTPETLRALARVGY